MRASFHRGTLRCHHTGNSKADEYQDGMLNGLCMHHAWTMGGIKPETTPTKQLGSPSYLLTAVCIIQGAPNFDSEIKSQSREHYISLNSALNLPFSSGHYSHKNKLVHQTNKCAKRSLQKFGVFEVLLLLTNTIPDERLIGNA